MTPRQFHLLIDQHRERVEHQELLAGIIASSVVNYSMGAPKRPTCPADFMPSRGGKSRTASASIRINRKQVAEDIRAWVSRMKAQPGSPVISGG